MTNKAPMLNDRMPKGKRALRRLWALGLWTFVGHWDLVIKTFATWVLVIGVLAIGASPAPAQMRVLDTPHYRIHTDLDQRLAEDLGLRMEAMFTEYSQRLADFNPPADRRFEVYLFKQRKDYAVFTNDELVNTGGIFIPRRNLLAAYLDPQGRDALHRTLQHEAFHQFAFTAISPRMPVWLNEGIAQVFEEGLWTGKRFMIGQVPSRRIRQLKQDISTQRIMPFGAFLKLDEKQWQKDLADPTLGAARYGQAWAMTHFLIFDKDQAGEPRYRTRLISMLKMLHGGKAADAAFVEAFSTNIQGFQSRFMEHARTLQPTREATWVEHQDVLADMLVLLNEDGQRFDDIAAFREALTTGGMRLRYSKGDMHWSTATDPTAYFRDDAGRVMNSRQLFFSPRGGAPLADLVCRPVDGLELRTVFHGGSEKIDHETLIEAKP